MRNAIYILLILIFVATTVIGYVLVERSKTVPPVAGVQETPDGKNGQQAESDSLSALYMERPGNAFMIGDNFLRQGPAYHAQARPFFEEALASALSPEQGAHIEYKLALTYTYDDPVESIRRMKALVANPSYPDQEKAYALQHVYRTYRNFAIDPALLPVIFEGDPYSGFYVENDIGLSFRKFHEYATSFGRVPISDASVAKWYASELAFKSAVRENETLAAEYQRNIEERLGYVEKYIEKNQNVINNSDLIPQTLILSADISGFLAISGIEDQKNLYADKYEAAIAANKGAEFDSVPRQGFAFISLFLNDTEGWNRARPLFDELIDNIDEYEGMKRAYLTYRDTPASSQARSIIFVANRYQKFKDMLLSIGWQQSDF